MVKLVGVVLLSFLLACGDDDDEARPLPDVSAATLNVLHGLFCPSETLDCRVDERMELVFDWVESIGCPDVLMLQEVLGTRVEEAIRRIAAERCPFRYEIHEPPLRSQNFTLSRYPVTETHEDRLLGGIRVLWHTRIDHPSGAVSVFNTHLAAGVDAGSGPCGEACPQECVAAGAETNRDCQAVQVADIAAGRASDDDLRILAGDFNAGPDTFVYRYLAEERGWQDSYVAAGNPPCDESTGAGCTSGREDEALDDMESTARGVRLRIDFLFVQQPASGATYVVDSRRDDDGDGLATMHFTDEPNPFDGECGALPLPICWPSDHIGVQADINCIDCLQPG